MATKPPYKKKDRREYTEKKVSDVKAIPRAKINEDGTKEFDQSVFFCFMSSRSRTVTRKRNKRFGNYSN